MLTHGNFFDAIRTSPPTVKDKNTAYESGRKILILSPLHFVATR